MISARKFYLDVIFVSVFIFYNFLKSQWGILHLVGFTLIIFSLPLWLLARVQLGKFFSVRPKASGLVTTGLYAKFRNPIYLFSSLTVLGAILPSGNPIQYIMYIILLVVQLIRIKAEEKLLLEKFGQKYLNYKRMTLI